jgi:tetratricopeptide (TPR) repeat protein
MRRALELHDGLLRRLLEEHGGYEAWAVGDAFLVAWQLPEEALRWCLDVQRALVQVEWPKALLKQPEAGVVLREDGAPLFRGLRVRMGMHVGEPAVRRDPRTQRLIYSGSATRRAGRLAVAANGGQILLTDVAWKEVQAAVEGEVAAADLGSHRFRDLSGLVRLVGVRPSALAERTFPDLHTAESERTNAQPFANLLVGRDEDLSALSELLSFGVRIATLVGGPGVGKSRLVRELAIRNLERWSGEDQGGVWVCDLSDSEAVEGLLQCVGSALGVPLTLGRQISDSVAQIGHALAPRGPLLLLLDGFERLGDASRESVVSWLRAAPTARVVITAESRLGVEGEVAYLLAPLGLPTEGHPTAAASVGLLTRRLRERVEGFRLSAEEQLRCGRLLELTGGLPLAIEMLAGQIGAHPIAELEADVAGRLEDPERATDRERLLAVFDLCLSRLRPWERGALARCSVFRNGFGLDAAEAVVDLSEWAGAPWVADAVERLRELGMLSSAEVPSAPGAYRYAMHPFVREAVTGSFPPHDRAATEDRHAEFFVSWGRPWADQVHRVDGSEALARLDEERLNLIAAVENSLGLRPLTSIRVNRALEALLVVSPLLAARGPFETQLHLLNEAVEAADTVEGVDRPLMVRILRERAEARRSTSQWGEARADIERALALAREAGFEEGEAVVLQTFGLLLRLLGKPKDAQAVLEQALERVRALGLVREEGLVLGNLGVVNLHLGNTEEARANIDEAIERFRDVGDRRSEGVQVGNLGVLHRRLGNLDRTRELYAEALEIHGETGDRRREGVMLGNLGVLQYHLGDLGSAFDLYDRSLTVAREVGDRLTEATALANIGLVYTELSQYDDALGLFHQALALNRDAGERSGEGCDAGFLGALHHLQGDLEKARDHYRRSLELLDREVERRYAGSFLSWAAACEAELGHVEVATTLFEESEECLESAGDPHLLAARIILLGAMDLATARQRADAGDQVGAARAREAARERMAEVRRELEVSQEPISGDLRLATKFLSERLGDLA